MNRLARIPEDVWEKLTISDAARAGLLGAFPDELARNGTDLLRDCGEWTMVARLLNENITTGTVQKACDIVRRREAKTSDKAMNPLEHAQFVAAVFGTTDDEAGRVKRERAERESTGHPARQGPPRLPVRDRMTRPARIPPDVWETLTVGEAVAADLLGEAALEMGMPDMLFRQLESGSVLAKCLRQNVENNHPEVDKIVSRRVDRIREMRTRDKPNRPRRIPADIWDAMTVREASDHEFFSRPHDGKGLHLNTYLHLFPTDSVIGQSIARKLKRIDDRTLEIRFRVIREERAQRRQASCQKHEFVPGGDVCIHCGMIIYAPDKRIQGAKADVVMVDDRVVLDRAKRLFRCVKHEVYTANGITCCSRCDASENEILDAILDPLLEEDETDLVHEQLHLISRSAILNAMQQGKGTKDLARDLTIVLHGKQQDIHPIASVPDSSPKFREDICRNDGPLLPPFEAGEPTDRVTVRMLYPFVATTYGGTTQHSARCALTLHELGNRFIEYRRRLSGPPSGFSWVSHPHEATAARTRIADEVLSFDLAVRTGEHLAVAAYGLILFALAVGAEREREQVRAVMSATDDAMDAVMRTAREASEGE